MRSNRPFCQNCTDIIYAGIAVALIVGAIIKVADFFGYFK
jgi:hypothetical protein